MLFNVKHGISVILCSSKGLYECKPLHMPVSKRCSCSSCQVAQSVHANGMTLGNMDKAARTIPVTTQGSKWSTDKLDLLTLATAQLFLTSQVL